MRAITRSDIVCVMAHITASVEYGLHCLLWLAKSDGGRASTRQLAALQGVSHSFLAKIFPKLEKAGIVSASDGLAGGYRLACPPEEISVLQVIDAIEGHKPLFDCRGVRAGCVLFDGAPPQWATKGTCSIHAVMLRAEKAMRAELAASSLGDLALTVTAKAPAEFWGQVQSWLDTRTSRREASVPARSS